MTYNVLQQFPKVCPCCKTTHTLAVWLRLPYKGIQSSALELRDCPCGSTIGVWLVDPEADDIDAQGLILTQDELSLWTQAEIVGCFGTQTYSPE